MSVENRQKLVIGMLLALVAIVAILVFLFIQQSRKPRDNNPLPRCNWQDLEKNNCVPAGRCTPPGDLREAVTDCDIKDYDHKFKY